MKPTFDSLYLHTPKTQKALGMRHLRDYYTSDWVPSFGVLYQIAGDTKPGDYENLFHYAMLAFSTDKFFARPCPTKPRHGFVDSRIISTGEELKAIYQATLAEDKQGELILMRPISAQFSGVMTPTLLTIGLGTDGATAGKAKSITFPHLGVKLEPILLSRAKIKNSPYIELLYRTHKSNRAEVYAVQLRDGKEAALATTDQIITKQVTVKEILRPKSGDLLEWEKSVKKAKEGTLIWLPNGNPLSHFTQHALLRDLPVSFAVKAPIVGQILRPTKTQTKPKVTYVSKGLLHRGVLKPLSQDVLIGAIWAVHNASALLPTRHGAELVGRSAMVLFRAASAAVLGELRHAHGPNEKVKRSEIYKQVFGKHNTLWRYRRRLAIAESIYNQGDLWRKSFGGHMWAECAKFTFALFKAISAHLKEPSNATIVNILSVCHSVIHSSHNGGPLLSKMGVSTGDFEYIAQGYMPWVAKGGLGAYLLLTEKASKESAAARKVRLLHWQTEKLYAKKVTIPPRSKGHYEDCNCSICKPTKSQGLSLSISEPSEIITLQFKEEKE